MSSVITSCWLPLQVFTCDENSSMKLAGSISPNKILIRNDLQNQGQQPQQHLQQVHNTLISSPESMTVSSDAKNELVGGLRLVRIDLVYNLLVGVPVFLFSIISHSRYFLYTNNIFFKRWINVLGPTMAYLDNNHTT